MNWKFLTYSILVLVIGLVIGGGGMHWRQNNRIKKAEMKIDDANRIIDSVSVANIQQKKVFHQEFIKYESIIQSYRERLNIRNEDFKNDTIIPSDDELILRARAAANYD